MRALALAFPLALLTFSAGRVAMAAIAAPALRLPYREAGLDPRQAAAHLLDRLAFGARPGEVERVVARGLERWVAEQIAAVLPEPELERRLATLPALEMPAREIAETYPPPFALLRMAEEAGVLSAEELEQARGGEGKGRREARRKVEAWMREAGLKSDRELLAQSYAQKLLRAVYAENQLREVLADFWFNHFNVAISDPPVRQYLLAYERDAIRGHLTGSFRAMLGATARHPAMLLYLDNFQSVANSGQPTTMSGALGRLDGRPGGGRGKGAGRGTEAMRRYEAEQQRRPNRPQGLNENYARELLELHTLGVDGGYTQQDVIEVARAFTGWTLVPAGRMGEEVERRLARAERMAGLGFARQGEFLFRADVHDAGEKRILGVRLQAGRGLEDGEQVLDLVAAHPATARHLAAKLAIRFVADEPPSGLVDRLAATYRESRGDLTQLLRALVQSPEFWSPAARGAKIKSPFEVAVSALRALDAEVINPYPTLEWTARMGQQLYAYQAPTGFPDRADFWVNSGALLARMNFGLELAAGRVGGLRFDLAKLTSGREPESAAAALATYAEQLLPERELAPTLARLEPLVAAPDFAARLAARAPGEPELLAMDDALEVAASPPRPAAPAAPAAPIRREGRGFARLDAFFPRPESLAASAPPPPALASAVGLVLGSPEFQRH